MTNISMQTVFPSIHPTILAFTDFKISLSTGFKPFKKKMPQLEKIFFSHLKNVIKKILKIQLRIFHNLKNCFKKTMPTIVDNPGILYFINTLI